MLQSLSKSSKKTKQIFFFMFVSISSFSALYSEVNPVILFHFNEGTGSTVNDLSGNNLDGTIYNATWTSDGNALSFNGTNARVTVPYNSAFNFSTESFSIETWIKTTQTTYGSIVRNHVSYGYNLFIENGKAKFGIDAGHPGAIIVQSTSNVNDGNWHHLVGVRDNSDSKIKIYVDGVLEGQVDDTVGDISSTTDLWIGGKSNNQLFYNGLIDFVGIWK